MLRKEAEHGITKVIATPHFYPQNNTPSRFVARRQEALEVLLEAARGEENLPQIELGAEVYFFSGISESDVLTQLTIGENGYILIEMPHSPWTKSMFRELAEIYSRWGITPIIAHVDRYISPLRTHGIPQQLEQMPVLVQANASFFLHYSTRNMALRMLRKDQIHLLGSDCHNMEERAPKLGDALRVIGRNLGSQILDTVEFYQEQVLGEDK